MRYLHLTMIADNQKETAPADDPGRLGKQQFQGLGSRNLFHFGISRLALVE